MTDFQLYDQINTLSTEEKKEVSAFISSLKYKTKSKKKIKARKFGYAKGFFKMARDFDAPLEDFKEYM